MVIIRSRLILLIACMITDTDRIGLHSFQLPFVIDEK